MLIVMFLVSSCAPLGHVIMSCASVVLSLVHTTVHDFKTPG